MAAVFSVRDRCEVPLPSGHFRSDPGLPHQPWRLSITVRSLCFGTFTPVFGRHQEGEMEVQTMILFYRVCEKGNGADD